MKKLNKMFRINPLYEADGYKPGHKDMLAPNTTRLYGTWIPRSLKYMDKNITKIMSCGQQLTWRYIHGAFKENFFGVSEKKAMKFARDLTKYYGVPYNGDHFKGLHNLGYLPIQVQALPEGIFTNPNIPHQTFINTHPDYAWLVLFLETLISKLSWQMPTAATISHQFRKVTNAYIQKTDKNNSAAADYLNHDFHSRGGNPFTSIACGLGHALNSKGSDTLNAIPASRYFYDVPKGEVIINSVNASEHSVSCTQLFYFEDQLRKGLLNDKIKEFYLNFDLPSDGSVDNPDYLTIAEWLMIDDWLDRFPKGILSIVNDTMNTWKHITHVIARLRDKILARDGKVVTRPDSGDPVDIICGLRGYKIEGTSVLESEWKDYQAGGMVEKWYPTTKVIIPEVKGVIELLWDIFGGMVNEQGYKVLDPHIGAIYGDSITLERQNAIYERLEAKRFASSNIVLGIGSYTYVLQTRDSAGFAAKGAWFEVEYLDSEGLSEGIHRQTYNIYKDPVTDDGSKKSLKGMQRVYVDIEGEFQTESEVPESVAYSPENLLKTIYYNGKFLNQTTFQEIQERIKNDKYSQY